MDGCRWPSGSDNRLRFVRLLLRLAPALVVLFLGWPFAALAADTDEPAELTGAPALVNPGFECDVGFHPSTNPVGETVYIPDGWNAIFLQGAPLVHSARLFFEGRADPAAGCQSERVHVERIEGRDSVVVRAQDLETPPTPGKPFDVALYQQVPVVSGTAYSLSGWFLSLCGGSAVPSDCPDGYYMDKLLGLDPAGGVDPLASTLVWSSDRRNFVDEENRRIGWSNLRTVAVAQAMTLTVFARLSSPFQWHGNHGFMDAISLVEAPTATLAPLPPMVVGNRSLEVRWDGALSDDIAAIPGGTYRLFFDLQVRVQGEEAWYDWIVGAEGAGSAIFTAACLNTTYEFRVRARAEQPPAPPEGAWPNHRYPGPWSEPMAVYFSRPPITTTLPFPGTARLYLPLVHGTVYAGPPC
ncbi:hypothetical protein FKZ61_021735 [Litorilinea aerophila]|uniref:Fibronectin type III domain-containing protein n=1 Tax=Litorilinea aerophila TaxID=1204385 RepID=A0A540V9F4_9CHLR|nr:hypothetical protein [Litorilinea aerophila]MCC9078721.1 hypothetical protein [Litorilinea aerophila]